VANYRIRDRQRVFIHVVIHDGVFNTFLLTSNIDINDDGHVGKSFLKRNEVARFRRRRIITRRSLVIDGLMGKIACRSSK